MTDDFPNDLDIAVMLIIAMSAVVLIYLTRVV